MPLYQLMTVGLTNEGLDGLEKLCRQFLWGWQEQGTPRTALVAWERVAQAKSNGGLGWTRFIDRARAMHIKCLMKILEGGESEWVQLSKSFMLRTLRTGWYQRERSQWTIEEGLWLAPWSKVLGSPTLTRMIRSWRLLQQRLTWNTETGVIPLHFSIAQVVAVMQKETEHRSTRELYGRCIAALRKGGIATIEDSERGRRRGQTWMETLRLGGVHPEQHIIKQIHEVEDWVKTQKIAEDANGGNLAWKWRENGEPFSGKESIKFWSKQFAKEHCFEELLNHRWGVSTQDREWKWRWRTLWHMKLTQMENFWRERNDKFFRNRVTKIPLHTLLKHLTLEVEAIPHLKVSDNTMEIMRRSRTSVANWRLTCDGEVEENRDNLEGNTSLREQEQTSEQQPQSPRDSPSSTLTPSMVDPESEERWPQRNPRSRAPPTHLELLDTNPSTTRGNHRDT
ncbi:hypothetical protein R1sor_023503 [Riccia sorocarpa]|uniref:Uncharacterized protein n=1 Tax=Riccia sorocarpa TaxID=122646 RepID=A0ABD3GPY8_9MARC